MQNSEVFISYSWKEESNTIANEIEQLLRSKNINVIRDKSSLGYKGLVKEFMNRLGKGKFIILILSEDYLKSENCMFELLQIAADNFYNRIYPLVLPGTNIYKAADRIKYVHYWENEINELEKAIKTGSLTNLQGIFSELDLYSEIRKNIDNLTTVLKNINVLSLPLQQTNNYQPLLDKLQSQLEADFGSSLTSETENTTTEYFELYLNKLLKYPSKKIIIEIEKNLNQSTIYEAKRHIDFLASVTNNQEEAKEIFDLYIQYQNFIKFKIDGRYFYLSLNKLTRNFNINRSSILTLYPNLLNENLSNEEKLKLLYKYYKHNGLIKFLNGELKLSNKVPLDVEPAIYFEGAFRLADKLSDHFNDLKYEKDSQNKISIGTAHYVLEYPDPFVFPVIQLEGEICGTHFTIAISRKYLPFTSGNTMQLTSLLSGDIVHATGFGSIEYSGEKHYQIQPILINFY